jgi:hypothetical protein
MDHRSAGITAFPRLDMILPLDASMTIQSPTKNLCSTSSRTFGIQKVQ